MRHSETNQKITTGKVEKYTRKIKQIGERVGERMNEWMNEWMGGPKSLFNAICEQSRKKKLTYKKTKNTSFVVMGLFSYRLLVNLLKWLSLLLFCSTTPYNRNLYNFWSPLFLLALFKKKNRFLRLRMRNENKSQWEISCVFCLVTLKNLIQLAWLLPPNGAVSQKKLLYYLGTLPNL